MLKIILDGSNVKTPLNILITIAKRIIVNINPKDIEDIIIAAFLLSLIPNINPNIENTNAGIKVNIVNIN